MIVRSVALTAVLLTAFAMPAAAEQEALPPCPAALAFVCWLVWLVGTVLVLLPQTGRAMRSYRTTVAG
jgi:hypothetical protein